MKPGRRWGRRAPGKAHELMKLFDFESGASSEGAAHACVVSRLSLPHEREQRGATEHSVTVSEGHSPHVRTLKPHFYFSLVVVPSVS